MLRVCDGKRANIGESFPAAAGKLRLTIRFPGIQVEKHGSQTFMPFSRRITDHDEIRRWAASCQAVPAEFSAGEQGRQLSALRFMFLDGSYNQPQLTPISWEDFLAKFDLLGLVLLCEDNRAEQWSKAYELVQSE